MLRDISNWRGESWSGLAWWRLFSEVVIKGSLGEEIADEKCDTMINAVTLNNTYKVNAEYYQQSHRSKR
jgi:hypothetical protein